MLLKYDFTIIQHKSANCTEKEQTIYLLSYSVPGDVLSVPQGLSYSNGEGQIMPNIICGEYLSQV